VEWNDEDGQIKQAGKQSGRNEGDTDTKGLKERKKEIILPVQL
jgi:hypothetical protein